MAACWWGRRGAAAAVLVFVLLGAGCGAGSPAARTTRSASQAGTNRRLAAGAARRRLAARYLAIARAGNRRLNSDFDRLEGGDWNYLGAATAELRDAAATERLFDHRLLQIAFPPKTERVAQSLYQVNQARAALTTTAAASTSLRELHVFKQALTYANGPVEQAVRTIRRQLGLPPPATS
jgi:hypothetical protein